MLEPLEQHKKTHYVCDSVYCGVALGSCMCGQIVIDWGSGDSVHSALCLCKRVRESERERERVHIMFFFCCCWLFLLYLRAFVKQFSHLAYTYLFVSFYSFLDFSFTKRKC